MFGANGAGKTTLLRILATLLRPHRGDGARARARSCRARAGRCAGRIGFLGHEPLLYRDLTARENLRFHARLHGVALARVDELLEAVGMRARADDPVHTSRAGWSSARRSAAPCCTSRSCCCSTSRSRASTRARRRGRAADRAAGTRVVISPRRRARAGRGRPRARPARRAAGAARARGDVDRGRRAGAVRMRRAVGALIRKDLRLELRTPRVGAGDGAVLARRRSCSSTSRSTSATRRAATWPPGSCG